VDIKLIFRIEDMKTAATIEFGSSVNSIEMLLQSRNGGQITAGATAIMLFIDIVFREPDWIILAIWTGKEASIEGD
jgi:hypothetical protein